MKDNITYRDFGVPNTAAPHHIVIKVPSDRSADAELWEDFGAAGIGTSLHLICRVILPRAVWCAIAPAVETHMNARIREKGLKTSRLRIGDNRIDRILGREVIVLAWAVEHMTPAQAEAAVARWKHYRPEEMWWLFQQIDIDGRAWDAPQKGWRAAIKVAFANNEISEEEKAA